jgi:NAD(P)-dependent dehydrogenase (short-subunit alcohol dehydrogenase family)/creatinine amidohydrolase/Fe(II)-dependent formamide hydrolase-like protein
VTEGRWGDLTWAKAADLPAGWLAILPVGALEAHGPHLPLRTDGVIAEAMAREGAQVLRAGGRSVQVLPTLDYTAAPFAAGFPGTVSVDPDAVVALLLSLARSLTAQGAEALVLANAHFDPTHLACLRRAARTGVHSGGRIVFPDVTRRRWAAMLTDEFRSGACHAGRYESSIVLAERPELVDDAVRAALPAFQRSLVDAMREGLETFEAAGGEQAYFGDPAAASAEEGRETVEALGRILAAATEEALAGEETALPDLAGRAAVVTGAGRGIGASIARLLGRSGARLVLAARSVDQIEAVASELRGQGVDAIAVACDVSDEDSVAHLRERASEYLGAVDILVSNAGIGHSAPLHRETRADWERVMGVNATGVFLCMRAFLPQMLEQGLGRIVNVSSVAGLAGARYVAAYSASKHAVIGLTRSVALEVEGRGVTVNAVCPGYVDTPMARGAVEAAVKRSGMTYEEAERVVLDTAGQPRMITPEAVAEAVLAYCAAEASDRNGEALLIDGRGGSS